jgi:hypothetical protein
VAAAALALPEMLAVLAPLNAKTVTLDRVTPDTLREALYPKGTTVIVAPLKKRKRSEEKVTGDYGGDWTRLTDVLRASVACDSEPEMREAIRTLELSGAKYAREPKDRYAHPLRNGYRDFQANYVLPSGFICEVQFHLKGLMTAREEGAFPYHFERTPKTDLTTQERQDADATERSRQDANYRESSKPKTQTKEQGAPCEQGETAAKTGCIPEEGGGTKKPAAPSVRGRAANILAAAAEVKFGDKQEGAQTSVGDTDYAEIEAALTDDEKVEMDNYVLQRVDDEMENWEPHLNLFSVAESYGLTPDGVRGEVEDALNAEAR